MYPESKPIIFKCPKEYDFVELYPVHDMHIGNECFDTHKWNKLKQHILSAPNRYIAWIGDLMENAFPGTKSDPLLSVMTPIEQREFIVSEFKDLKDRTVAIDDGNHEDRSARVGLYPLYDAACIAGVEDKYRSIYSVLDISVGRGADGHENRQQRYIGFLCHKAKELKNYGMADFLENLSQLFSRTGLREIYHDGLGLLLSHFGNRCRLSFRLLGILFFTGRKQCGCGNHSRQSKRKLQGTRHENLQLKLYR